MVEVEVEEEEVKEEEEEEEEVLTTRPEEIENDAIGRIGAQRKVATARPAANTSINENKGSERQLYPRAIRQN